MKFFESMYANALKSGLILTLAAGCNTAGMIMVVAYTTWIAFPAKIANKTPELHGLLLCGLWALVVAVVLGILSLRALSKTKPDPAELRYSNIMFGRALVGIGYFLLLDALLNVVAISGFAANGYEKAIFRPSVTLSLSNTNLVGASTQQKPEPTGNAAPTVVLQQEVAGRMTDGEIKNLITAIQLLFALGFTIMGALFFFAKSLWEKMQDPNPVQYDERIFWAGLWFRLGEAVVFTLVMFVALLFKQQEASGWMPLIALVIGLSVKTAENLIAGTCERLLAAVNGLINK